MQKWFLSKTTEERLHILKFCSFLCWLLHHQAEEATVYCGLTAEKQWRVNVDKVICQWLYDSAVQQLNRLYQIFLFAVTPQDYPSYDNIVTSQEHFVTFHDHLQGHCWVLCAWNLSMLKAVSQPCQVFLYWSNFLFVLLKQEARCKIKKKPWSGCKYNTTHESAVSASK